MLNSSKCKFLHGIRRRAPCFPAELLLLCSEILNKLTVNVTLVSKYSANSPGLTTYIKQVSTKARRLVGMLYSFNSWADTATLLNLYLTCVHSHLEYTCVRSHLEYVCTLWDPYAYKNIFMLESVQNFALKVCLKQWELDCDSMLHLLGITRLSTHRQSQKLVTFVQSSKWPNLFPSWNFCS